MFVRVCLCVCVWCAYERESERERKREREREREHTQSGGDKLVAVSSAPPSYTRAHIHKYPADMDHFCGVFLSSEQRKNSKNAYILLVIVFQLFIFSPFKPVRIPTSLHVGK